MKLFKAKTQTEFLSLAYKFYRARIIVILDNHLWTPRHDIKTWLYKLGRDYNVLDIDFNEFERVLLNKCSNYRNGNRHIPRRFHRWLQYRLLLSFTYSGQSKKSKKDTLEKAWRRKKKFSKDKSKARYCNSHWKKNLKTVGAKKHRRKEHRTIKDNQVDRLGADSYKRAENPWSWN